MKTTWIITSALSTSAGVFEAKARVAQTHETMNTIMDFYPDAMFVLVEGGKPFTGDVPGFPQLRERCHLFVDLRQDERIAWLHRNIFDVAPDKTDTGGIVDVTKSLAEATLMAIVTEAFAAGQVPRELVEVDRIFKISGRYQLSPIFDVAAYEGIGDKYVFRRRQATWMPDALQRIGVDQWFASRLWSFAPSRLRETSDKMRAVLRDMQELGFRQKVHVNVEHLLFKHFRDEDIVEFDHTHVMGNIGPSGRILYD
jgi:hypothetical protein